MASSRNRERESSALQYTLIGALVAVCVLALLVFKTLSFDQPLHQQRLAAMRVISSLDTEINRLFIRLLAEAGKVEAAEKQQVIERMSKAINTLQEPPLVMSGLSADVDLAVNTFIETVLTKFKIAGDVKPDQTARLRNLIELPTGPQLAAVEQAYQAWVTQQIEEANFYRAVLVAYTVLLLLSLGFLGYRLRLSYRALDKANAGLRDANRTLESQVQARTKDLTKTLHDLRESQAQLIQSEKMASLGTMVAGVAHEINTPLGYARSNAGIVRTSLGAIRELCDAQGKALGLLTAANSSEDDIATALAQADEVRESVQPEELMGDLDNLLADTDHGLVQIADLVSSLKDFSRVDRSRNDLFDLNAGVDSALKICNNQLKGRVDVVRYFTKLPEIECSPSQINQVFLNLINNAAQAIDGEGIITIETIAEKAGVVVKLTDTGCGMTDEVKKRIFEPFYTTKPVGHGTGLGLSIVFRIVEEHGGRITVDSKPGEGTTFTLRLPLKQAPALAAVA